jgi:uncharacterized integral membrane protein
MTQHHHGHSEPEIPRKKVHKDWRVWAAVVLMLAAIMIYVLTLDDSLLSMVLRPFVC